MGPFHSPDFRGIRGPNGEVIYSRFLTPKPPLGEQWQHVLSFPPGLSRFLLQRSCFMGSRSSSSDQMGFDFGEFFPNFEEGKTPVERGCTNCKVALQVPGWYARKGPQLHFCSADCRQAWIEEHPSFDITLEKRYRRRGANWEIQSGAARKRDGYTCQECGMTETELGRQLDVHHKIPFRSFKSNVEANKLEHLISVCPTCHAKLEAQLRTELPLFRKSKRSESGK